MSVDVSSANAVQEPSAVSFSNGVLVSAWLNLDTLPSTDAGAVALQLSTFQWVNFDVRTSFSTGDTLLRITYDGASYLDWFDDVTLGSLTGAWHHVLWHMPLSGSAATDAQVWVDGVLRTGSWDAGPTSWTISSISSAGVNLGGSAGFSYAFDGQIAEVGLWDTATAPSSADISALSDGTGATRPGDLTSLSSSLVFYAPLTVAASYVLDTPTGTLSDVGTGSTSIVAAHPTMASAGGSTITATGTCAATSSVAVDLARAARGVGTQAATSAVAVDLARGLQTSGTRAATSAVAVDLARAVAGTGTRAATSAAAVDLARAAVGVGTRAATSSVVVDLQVESSTITATGTRAATSSVSVDLARAVVGVGARAATSSVAVDLRVAGGTLTATGTRAATSSAVVELGRALQAAGVVGATSSVAVDVARATVGVGALAGTSAVSVELQQVIRAAGSLAATTSVVVDLSAVSPGAMTAWPALAAVRAGSALGGRASASAGSPLSIGRII